MSNKLKLKRITDLFSEGDICFLGNDESGAPVCIWVNKPNSLEEDEARRDAQSARTELLLALADPMHPEMQNLHMTLSEWTDHDLHQALTNQKYEENLNLALLDIESDKEWEDRLEYLRRQPELLDDAKVPDDDPRRAQLVKYNEEYMTEVDRLLKERTEQTEADIKLKTREECTEEFVKAHKDKLSTEHYLLEARVTKVYFALRECDAAKTDKGDWDHQKCNHNVRLLADRKQVRELPDGVLLVVLATFDNLAVGARNVANFPDPQNSSDSSVQQDASVA